VIYVNIEGESAWTEEEQLDLDLTTIYIEDYLGDILGDESALGRGSDPPQVTEVTV